MSSVTGAKGKGGGYWWSAGLGRSKLIQTRPFSNPKSAGCSLSVFHREIWPRLRLNSLSTAAPKFGSILDLLGSEFGWVRVKGGKVLRSKGAVSEARVATVTSEVAHPGGEKAA